MALDEFDVTLIGVDKLGTISRSNTFFYGAVTFYSDVFGLDFLTADLRDELHNLNTLGISEKIRIISSLQRQLEIQYSTLYSRATSLGVSTSTLVSARDSWNDYLDALDPEWDNFDVNTPLNRDFEYTEVLPGLSPPGTTTGNNPWTATATSTDVTVGSHQYRRVNDTSASVAQNTASPWTAGFLEGQYFSIVMKVRKDATATAYHSQVSIQTDDFLQAAPQVNISQLSFNVADGTYTSASGTGGLIDLDDWGFTDEWLVWLTGVIPDATPDNDRVRMIITPARGLMPVSSGANVNRTGSIDVRDILFIHGTFDPVAWLDALGRDAFWKRLSDYWDALANAQYLIDASSSIGAGSILTNGDGSNIPIADVPIPVSFESIDTDGFYTGGDGGGTTLKLLGTTTPNTNDYDVRLVPGESDLAVPEAADTSGDGFFPDASGPTRWFDIYVPSKTLDIRQLGAREFDPNASGSENLLRRQESTIAFRKALRIGAGGSCLVRVPETDEDRPFELSFAGQLYNGQRLQIDGMLRQTRGDEIARYGEVSNWSTLDYFSKSCLISGHQHTGNMSYLSRMGNGITWSGTTPIYGTNTLANTAENIIRPVYGVLNGLTFTVEADNARINPAYGARFGTKVGPGLRVGGDPDGQPLLIFPDAVTTWLNQSVNYAGHISDGRFAVGMEVIVCTHSGYKQPIGRYSDDPYDPGTVYRGSGGTCFQWDIRERRTITGISGTTITFDEEIPDVSEWTSLYGTDVFIIPANRPDIVESRTAMSLARPHLIRNVHIFGNGGLENVIVPADGRAGASFNYRSGAAQYHIDIFRTGGDYGLGGNFFHDSSQRFTEVYAQRKLADIACGCKHLLIEFETLYGGWDGAIATSTGMVVNEASRNVTVRGKSVRTTSKTQGIRFNAATHCDVEVEEWIRSDGDEVTTIGAVVVGTSTQSSIEDADSAEDFDGWVGPQVSRISNNRAKINRSVTPNSNYYLQMLAGSTFTLEGNFYGDVSRDAVILNGDNNVVRAFLENGSIRLPKLTTASNIIDSNVPIEGIIGFSTDTVDSVRTNGSEIYQGKNEYVSMISILTASANFADGDTITIGESIYTMQSTLTDVDGNVKIGATRADSLTNLANAINLTGTPGTQYAASMMINADAEAAATSTTINLKTKSLVIAGIRITTLTTSAVATFPRFTMYGDTVDTTTSVNLAIDFKEDRVSTLNSETVMRLNGGGGVNLSSILNATPGKRKILSLVNANDSVPEGISFNSDSFIGPDIPDIVAGLTTVVIIEAPADGTRALITIKDNINLIAPGVSIIEDPSFASGGSGTAYDPFTVDLIDEVLRNDEEIGPIDGDPAELAYSWASGDLVEAVQPSTEYDISIIRRAGDYGTFNLRVGGIDNWAEVDSETGLASRRINKRITTDASWAGSDIELWVAGAIFQLSPDDIGEWHAFDINSQFDDVNVRKIVAPAGSDGSFLTYAHNVDITAISGMTANNVQSALAELNTSKANSSTVTAISANIVSLTANVATLNTTATDLSANVVTLTANVVSLTANVATLASTKLNITDAGWVEVASWTYSTNVPLVDFTNLGDYQTIRMEGSQITIGSAVGRQVLVSDNNGSSFYSTNGYFAESAAGALTSQNFIEPHGGTSSAARDGFIEIAINVNNKRKMVRTGAGTNIKITATNNVINAIRFQPDQSGGAVNITGGSIKIWGRKYG